MKDYYYVISSLPELELDSGKKEISLDDFFDFCESQLDEKDFEDLKKILIFNDIINIVSYFENEEQKFKKPYSFYTYEFFLENKKDSSMFFPFLGEVIENIENDKRFFPDLNMIDEVFVFFYENINTFTNNDFLKRYFNLILDLKNLSIYHKLKKMNINYENSLIPSGEAYDRITKSVTVDNEVIPLIDKLIEQLNGDNLVEIEKKMDEIVWYWLDDNVGYNIFSFNAVLSYGIKLLTIERWNNLTDENGEKTLQQLINNIKNNIKFSDIFKTGGRK